MSSSAYPVIWAMKHAPVADALERLILIAMADAADSDGCNSYRSYRSHALIAKDVDEATIRRRQRAMQKRGLIRRDTTPPPARYLQIPKNRRPPRWEICIPYSWWSAAQREEIQRERRDRGLPPITAESRPDLPDAPARKPRADKGKPNPNRRPKKARSDGQQDDGRGLSQRAQETSRGVYKTPPGVSTRDPQGCLQDTQPSFVDLPGEPSSSSDPFVGCVQEEEGSGEEEGRPEAKDQTDAERRAAELVDQAVAQWARPHRRPSPGERHTLAERVQEVLARGAPPDGVVYALTRDLEPSRTRSAVAVVMARTARPGWADQEPPTAPEQAPRTAFCRRCRTDAVVGHECAELTVPDDAGDRGARLARRLLGASDDAERDRIMAEMAVA